MLVSSSASALYFLDNVSLHARVKAVDLHINKGQCWHFLGPNGAGKSSLVLLLAGIETPSQGVLKLDNIELSTLFNHMRNPKGTHMRVCTAKK